MWRAIVFLTLAILCSALVVALISVYVFHDVDRDKLGHLNEVFADLAVEAADYAARHSLAMADAVIYATAMNAGADLLTCDAHFANLPGVVYFAKSSPP